MTSVGTTVGTGKSELLAELHRLHVCLPMPQPGWLIGEVCGTDWPVVRQSSEVEPA